MLPSEPSPLELWIFIKLSAKSALPQDINIVKSLSFLDGREQSQVSLQSLLNKSHTSGLIFNHSLLIFGPFFLPQTDLSASAVVSGVLLARSTDWLFVRNKQVMLVELADLFMACPSRHAWLSRPYTANVARAGPSIAKSPAGSNIAWNIDMVPARCHTWHLIHSLRCSFLILSSQQGIKGKCQRSFVWHGGKTEPVSKTHFYELTHTQKRENLGFLGFYSQLNLTWNVRTFFLNTC